LYFNNDAIMTIIVQISFPLFSIEQYHMFESKVCISIETIKTRLKFYKYSLQYAAEYI